MGEERGQPETGSWIPAADQYPAEPSGYRPRRAKPEPPDPYLPHSNYPPRPGPYVAPPGSSATARYSAARPDPLRDPVLPPYPGSSRDQAWRAARRQSDGWRHPGDVFESGRYPESPASADPSWAGSPGGEDPRGGQPWDRASRGGEPGSRRPRGGEQRTGEQRTGEQPAAEWHAGKRYTEDEPVRPSGPRGGGLRADAERYPADSPTQVFMSSALAAWEQSAQPPPPGWSQTQEPPDPRWARDLYRDPGPRSAQPPTRQAGPSRAQPPSPPTAARREWDQPQAGSPPGAWDQAQAGGAPSGWDRASAGGPSSVWDRAPAAGPEQYPPAGQRRAAGPAQAAPFPPAPHPAELYPQAPGPVWSGANPPPPSQPGEDHRVWSGVLIGFIAALVIVIVVLLFAL